MSPMNAEHARLLVRPTVDTRFHIDFGWWEKAERDWEVYLRSHLCEQHRASYAELETSSAAGLRWYEEPRQVRP